MTNERGKMTNGKVEMVGNKGEEEDDGGRGRNLGISYNHELPNPKPRVCIYVHLYD